jgi:hypothetical protein
MCNLRSPSEKPEIFADNHYSISYSFVFVMGQEGLLTAKILTVRTSNFSNEGHF